MDEAGDLDALEQLLRAGLRQHRQQMTRLVRLRSRGTDTACARRVLEALGDCLDVICGHRQQILSSRGRA